MGIEHQDVVRAPLLRVRIALDDIMLSQCDINMYIYDSIVISLTYPALRS